MMQTLVFMSVSCVGRVPRSPGRLLIELAQVCGRQPAL
jgi:hypothetical protein